MELLTLALFVSSLTVLNWAGPLEQSDVAAGEGLATLVPGTQAPALLGNGDEEDEEELAGGPDFEDDDDDDNSFLNLADSKGGHVDSLMHVHHKGGEILVPCFGMWWPVGGGGYPVYEYVDDYYGDYKKKRKSRKRKRAKAKRKKS